MNLAGLRGLRNGVCTIRSAAEYMYETSMTNHISQDMERRAKNRHKVGDADSR